MITAAVPELGRKSVSSLLATGFDAINVEVARNAERGESTDIADLIEKLHEAIMIETGYDYSVRDLLAIYPVWLMGQGIRA